MQAPGAQQSRTAVHQSPAFAGSLARASTPPLRVDGQDADQMPVADGEARMREDAAVAEAARCALASSAARGALLVTLTTHLGRAHARARAACARAAEPHRRAALRCVASKRLMRRGPPLRRAAQPQNRRAAAGQAAAPLRVHLRAPNGRYLCLAGGVPRAHATEPCCCEELLLLSGAGLIQGSRAAAHPVFAACGTRLLSVQPDGSVAVVQDAGDTGCVPAAPAQAPVGRSARVRSRFGHR